MPLSRQVIDFFLFNFLNNLNENEGGFYELKNKHLLIILLEENIKNNSFGVS